MLIAREYEYNVDWVIIPGPGVKAYPHICRANLRYSKPHQGLVVEANLKHGDLLSKSGARSNILTRQLGPGKQRSSLPQWLHRLHRPFSPLILNQVRNVHGLFWW